MFYKMIENKCTQWYESERCTVKNLIEYIEKTGQMRDAQIEAIKVYLFLKIACECKPLTQLFRQGFFIAHKSLHDDLQSVKQGENVSTVMKREDVIKNRL